MAVGAMIGAAIGGTASAIMGGNVWQGMLNGAISGAIGGGFGYIGQCIGGWVAAGVCGAAAGALSSAITGGDVGMGAIIGGISGAVVGLMREAANGQTASVAEENLNNLKQSNGTHQTPGGTTSEMGKNASEVAEKSASGAVVKKKIKLALYDGADKGDMAKGVAGGRAFKNAASDCDYALSVKDVNDAVNKVGEFVRSHPDLEITDLYIFDHGSPANQSLGITDESIVANEKWKMLSQHVSPKGRIHLCGCRVAQNFAKYANGQAYIQGLADKGLREVIAYDRTVTYYPDGRWLPFLRNFSAPYGSKSIAVPGGGTPRYPQDSVLTFLP